MIKVLDLLICFFIISGQVIYQPLVTSLVNDQLSPTITAQNENIGDNLKCLIQEPYPCTGCGTLGEAFS